MPSTCCPPNKSFILEVFQSSYKIPVLGLQWLFAPLSPPPPAFLIWFSDLWHWYNLCQPPYSTNTVVVKSQSLIISLSPNLPFLRRWSWTVWGCSNHTLSRACIPHTVLSIMRAPQNWCCSLWYGTRLPLGQRGARLGMDCTADLLLVLVLDKTASGTARSKKENRQLSSAMLLLTVPYAVSSHNKTRRITSTRPSFARSGCPDAGIYQYQSWI